VKLKFGECNTRSDLQKGVIGCCDALIFLKRRGTTGARLSERESEHWISAGPCPHKGKERINDSSKARKLRGVREEKKITFRHGE